MHLSALVPNATLNVILLRTRGRS